MNTVPILIGVTGHRSINNSDYSVLYESVQKELRAIQSRCPHTEIKMLNSLAVGADRLCARAALDLKIPLIAVLPFEKERYESDFNEAETAEFRALLKEAEQIITAPASEADEPDGRDAGYRRAGVYLCVHAHALLALWNGEEGKTGGCGTADIVACKLHDAFLPKEGTPISCMHAVICVHTPREGEDGAAGEVRFLGEKEAFDGVLKDTDDFNALCAQTNAAQTPFTEEVSDDPAVKRMEAVYAAADALSMKFAVRYRRILALLAVCSTTVTAAFLLYDEAELHWMIVLCGAALLLCFFLIRFARRSNCHRAVVFEDRRQRDGGGAAASVVAARGNALDRLRDCGAQCRCVGQGEAFDSEKLGGGAGSVSSARASKGGNQAAAQRANRADRADRQHLFLCGGALL